MHRKSLLAATLFAAALAGSGATAAFAGEITGTGQPTPIARPTLQAASICSFSGLNDTPTAPGPEGGRTQSFGAIVSQVGPLGGVPGTACNPSGHR